MAVIQKENIKHFIKLLTQFESRDTARNSHVLLKTLQINYNREHCFPIQGREVLREVKDHTPTNFSPALKTLKTTTENIVFPCP